MQKLHHVSTVSTCRNHLPTHQRRCCQCISLPDLQYVRILLEHLHRSFNASEQLSDPSNAAGNGRKVARCCRACLLRLVYDAHLLQVSSIRWQNLHILGCHIQLARTNLLEFYQQLKRLLRLKRYRKLAQTQSLSSTNSNSANSF